MIVFRLLCLIGFGVCFCLGVILFSVSSLDIGDDFAAATYGHCFGLAVLMAFVMFIDKWIQVLSWIA